jgi:hypothetical protein
LRCGERVERREIEVTKMLKERKSASNTTHQSERKAKVFACAEDFFKIMLLMFIVVHFTRVFTT